MRFMVRAFGHDVDFFIFTPSVLSVTQCQSIILQVVKAEPMGSNTGSTAV